MATTPIAPVQKPRTPRKSNGPKSHTTVVNFTEPEDIALYEYLEGKAKQERRQLGVYILLALHQQFPAQPEPTE